MTYEPRGDLLAARGWAERAVCTADDAEKFDLTPVPGETRGAWVERLADAVALCRMCPVALTCLGEALVHGNLGEVRGGLALPWVDNVPPDYAPCRVEDLRWAGSRATADLYSAEAHELEVA